MGSDRRCVIREAGFERSSADQNVIILRSGSFYSKSLQQSAAHVGEWLSLVEHLVRDQGVGGSNPLSPTNLSLARSIAYAAFLVFVLAAFFGTFGTIETEFGNSKPIPYSAAFCFRNATLSFTMSYRSSIEFPACPSQ